MTSPLLRDRQAMTVLRWILAALIFIAGMYWFIERLVG